MKLAEALMLRADHQKKVEQLRQRLMRNAKVQDGEQPAEDPQVLLGELDDAITQLTSLIQRINRSNSATDFGDNTTLTDALAQRDTLLTRRNVLSSLVQAASITHDRYSRSEVRFVSTVNIADLQRQLESISQEYRLLDSRIQALNWQVDLLNA